MLLTEVYKNKKYNELICFSKYKMNMLENDKKNNICFDFTSEVSLINYCFNNDWQKTILILPHINEVPVQRHESDRLFIVLRHSSFDCFY